MVREKVMLRIESTPEGADVFRVPDGLKLGRTPLDYERDREAGTLVFLVRRPGFKETQVEQSTLESSVTRLTLVADEPVPAPSRIRKRTTQFGSEDVY
jgi:hypothetical protein